MANDGSDGISIGGVLARSFDVMRANPAATLGISALIVALPQLLFHGLGATQVIYGDAMNGQYAAAGSIGLLTALLWLVAGGAIVQATVAHDEGRKATPGEVLRVGLRRAPALFVVYALYLIGVWIGTIFLLVPGLMFATTWAVALPAIVAERPGIVGAFSRSRALTKGARWHIFGILMLAFVAYCLVLIVLSLFGSAGQGTLAALRGDPAAAIMLPSLFERVVQSLVSTVLVTWLTALGATLFVALRRWKDGPGTDRLAAIFA